ncbi:hypothetical protein COT87_00325 [Candidatus Collierbacteria bacterium CG10_big_fil_rev_8_21_14_0_10_44_9]|uniref:Prepilin-type N-terminal cleavage/methylation domain-containing protein n=1 Tax=Candidatus Collierbacteria bacterium CG10_big_fil_rev_8_21_14_0_10_44_9 TaxID=1974535 RepID=A0A2H0VJI8_9BACT|nr:MAG: hypothetical protein COT87_00325 [Candidatus Collierbacteria bacterium CG10_big_fil_rev_8_21_14_0_10_44_9]
MTGLSLVELLLVLGITSILILVIGGAYSTHLKIVSNQNAAIDVAAQNQLGLDVIANDIRDSAGVSDSCCSPAETTSDQKLVVKIWPISITTSEPIQPASTDETQFDHIVYERDAVKNNLMRKIIPCTASAVPPCTSKRTASTKIIASHTSNLSFTYDPDTPSFSAATQVAITLTTNRKDLGKDFTNSQTTKVFIRNK